MANPMAAGIGPLENTLQLPLTLLPTEKPLSRNAQRVVKCFRLHYEGHWGRCWWECRLKSDDYAQVLRVLDADEDFRGWVEHKVR